MDDAALNAFALNQGLDKTTEQMTEQEVAMLRYKYVMEQTGAAAGNFEKTSGSWANQTTILTGSWKDFLTLMGTELIQLLTPAVDFLNSVMSSLKDFTKVISGEELGEDVQLSPGLQKLADIVEKFKNIDLSSVNSAFEGLKNSLAPFNQTVGSGLESFLNNILQPLSQWVIEDAVPVFLDNLSGAFSIITPVIDAAKENLQWLWDDFLQPIAKWTGGKIVSILQNVSDKLKEVGDWLNEHKEGISNFLIVLAAMLTALAVAWALDSLAASAGTIAISAWIAVSSIATAVTTAFGAAMNFLTSPITLVVLAIGLLIAVVILCVKYWDEIKAAAIYAWEFIQLKWQEAGEWFNVNIIIPIQSFFTGLWEGIKGSFSAAWEWIKAVWNFAVTWIQGCVIIPIQNFFTGLWEGIKGSFSAAWEWIKAVWSFAVTWINEYVIFPIRNFFTGLWDGIKNSFTKAFDFIKSAFKNFVNGSITMLENFINFFIKGINSLIGMLNKISFKAPDWLGGKTFGINIKTIPNVSIPRLATGAVIPPNSEFLAVLGDQRKGRNLEAPESLIRQIVKEEGSGDVTVIVQMPGGEEREIFSTKNINRRNRISGKVIVPVGV